MRIKFLLLLIIIISYTSFAQNTSKQFEIMPYARFDKYPEFTYILAGRPSVDYININSISVGLDISIKVYLSKSLLLKPGIGYYRYSFNNIKRENTNFGNSHSRNIIFPSTVFISFHTRKYWYNCLSANFGVEKLFYFRNKQVIAGLEVHNYFTFSQHYRLTRNPIGSEKYRKHEKRYFGSSLDMKFGIDKKIGNNIIRPTLILSVFDLWKTDATFYEETNSGTRHKFSMGVGIGLAYVIAQ